MTLFNIFIGDKSPELGRIRLAALCIVILMAACAFGERAHAAVDCGLKAPHHAAGPCRAHPLRAAGHETETSVPGNGSGANDSNGARLIPLSPAASPVRSASTPRLGALSHIFHGQAGGIEASALPLDRGSVVARVSDARGALGDVMQRAHTPGFSAHVFSPPVAWSLLLAGLLGLFMMTRGARVALAESWATVLPTGSARQPGTRASALDRLDVARYIQAPTHSAHQGHFVRAAGVSRFG
jgi:hypothetical protein